MAGMNSFENTKSAVDTFVRFYEQNSEYKNGKRKMCYPEEVPVISSFIKIFWNENDVSADWISCKIRPAYAKKAYPQSFPYVISLVNDCGIVWEISTSRDVDQHLHLSKGWELFVLDNKMKLGEYMLFNQVAAARFHVKIFGGDSCVKANLYSGILGESRIRHRIEDHVSEITELSKVVREVIKYCLGPAFEVLINPANCSEGGLTIPRDFVMEHLRVPFINQEVTMFCDNRLSTVTMEVDGDTFRLSKQFPEFIKENGIHVGSRIRFRSIGTDVVIFDVSVLDEANKSGIDSNNIQISSNFILLADLYSDRSCPI